MLDAFAHFIVHEVSNRELGIACILNIVGFFTVSILRQKRQFQLRSNGVGAVLRCVFAILGGYTGLLVFSVFIVMKPPMVDGLSESDLLMIGVVSSVTCVYMSLVELYKLYFEDSASS